MNGLKTRLSAASANREIRRGRYPTPGLIPRRIELFLSALAAAWLAAGCATVPSQKLPAPRKAVRIDNAGSLAGREWFWGIHVMGKRVGYSYLKIEMAPSMNDVLKITSKMKLDEIIKYEETQIDYSKLDLTLLRSEHVRVENGEARRIIAVVRPDRLELETTTRDKSKWRTEEIDHYMYPSSLINILPIIKGLWMGNSYRYPVFMPSTASVVTVRQRVKGYEKLEEFGRPAFRLTTKLRGRKTRSWIDARGNMLLEKGDFGLFSMSLVLENP